VAHAKRNGFNDIALFFNDAQQLKYVMPALGTIDGVRYRVVLADWIKGGRGANCTHFEWAQAWVLQHCLYQAKAEGIPYVLYQDTDEFLVKTSGENPLDHPCPCYPWCFGPGKTKMVMNIRCTTPASGACPYHPTAQLMKAQSAAPTKKR